MEPSAGGALPSELVARFERDGFVVVPDLLAAEELDELGPLVDAAVAARTRGDRRALAEKSAYEQSFLQCINLWEDHPEIRRLTFHPRIARAAAELLGAPALRLWHDQALYKEAGGRGTEPHQDHPYWPIAETDAVTAWIPFDAVTLESGAMGYLPGSHRVGLRRFANIFTGSTSELLERPELRGIEPRFVELARGAVAFHHGLTVHLARPNRTPRTRRVHTAIYFRDGSTRAQRGVHQSVDRAGIAPGAAIASDATPIAWPRAGGAPPTPSSPIPEGSIGRHLWPRVPGRDAPAPAGSARGAGARA